MRNYCMTFDLALASEFKGQNIAMGEGLGTRLLPDYLNKCSQNFESLVWNVYTRIHTL